MPNLELVKLETRLHNFLMCAQGRSCSEANLVLDRGWNSCCCLFAGTVFAESRTGIDERVDDDIWKGVVEREKWCENNWYDYFYYLFLSGLLDWIIICRYWGKINFIVPTHFSFQTKKDFFEFCFFRGVTED